LAKNGYSPFWILASRGKKPKKPHDGKKFCIFDRTKHDPENFGILHSTIPKYLAHPLSYECLRKIYKLS